MARLRFLLYPLVLALVIWALLINKRFALDGLADVPRNHFTGEFLVGKSTERDCRYYQELLVMAVDMYGEELPSSLEQITREHHLEMIREGYLTSPSRPLGHGEELFHWDMKGTSEHPPPRVVCLRHGRGRDPGHSAAEGLAELGISDPTLLSRAAEEVRNAPQRRWQRKVTQAAINLGALGLVLLSVMFAAGDLAKFRKWLSQRGQSNTTD